LPELSKQLQSLKMLTVKNWPSMAHPVSLFTIQPVLQHLLDGHLLLTPNQRLASRIRNSFALSQQQAGNQVVETPQVYSLQHWFERCWQHLLQTANPMALSLKRLTATQEQHLWEQLVTSSSLGAALLRPAATALQAASGFRALQEWQLDINKAEIREQLLADPDAAILLNWIEQFLVTTEAENYLASAAMPQYLLTAFKNNSIDSVKEILLVDFEDIAPLHKAVIESAGHVTVFSTDSKAADVEVVVCDNSKQEMQAAAVWAKQQLKNNADARVAIIVPNLAVQLEAQQRVLLEVFDPAYNQPLNDNSQPQSRRNLPFNISAGAPLLDAPIVLAAINALSLVLKELDVDTLERICQSPFYLLQSSDQINSSRLISRLRKQQVRTLRTAHFRYLAQSIAGEEQPWFFAECLHQIANQSRDHIIKQQRTGIDWLPVFKELLTTIGWPGKRQLDSIEYQQVTQLQRALDHLCSLDSVRAAVSFSDILSELRGVLSRQIFQPQTSDSPLQVLGTLEAAGLNFSHIWLQSMTEQQWPAAASPHPLLPNSLQRQYAMPHATAERELNYAAALSQRFIHSAEQMVVSYPATVDATPASVSPLFAAYPLRSLTDILGRSLDALFPQTEIRRRHLESRNVEQYVPGAAIPLQVEDSVKGGSAIFTSQSACPFSAFAKHRLGLRALANVEPGLTAGERGTLLHKALELLWQKLQDSNTLMATEQGELDQLCNDAARYAVEAMGQKIRLRFGRNYQQLEQQRLSNLLISWLEVERERSEFVVVEIENRRVFHFKSLQLEVRIDRIDRLADGRFLIVDYKSGKTSPSQWWGDRPDQPQLPLYNVLLSADQPIAGIAFAEINANKTVLNGVGDHDAAEIKIQWRNKHSSEAGVLDWPHLQQRWQKVLSSLAQDFIDGKVAVDPKQASSCQYCDYASVCRVDHQDTAVASMGAES
jgi:probable DNA repair protein